MMDPINESAIEEFARMKLEGESYAEIRARLIRSGISEDELKEVMRKIDERVLREATEQVNLERSRQWYLAGIIIAVAGLILAIGFNAGIILADSSRVLAYSPFFLGIVIMLYGKKLKQGKKGSAVKDPGRIRRKRPYK